MMRKLTLYAAASVLLSTVVVAWAFYERPNFYSAAVYLSQTNACLMALSNTALLCVGAAMYGMERLFFGSLRLVEIEQLYERGWFAVTEWLFAMSTFRDEFGVWFLSMFTTLFFGKLWGWIAEGRIESLEQQPPAQPSLFHSRLMASLALYALFAIHMFWYCADTVVYEARPGAMVMFVFEFAIILISAFSIILRYLLWWEEHRIIGKQIKQKKEERNRQRIAATVGIGSAAASANIPVVDASTTAGTSVVEPEDCEDDDDLEVPGWESKGAWLFALDIGTDFLKLVAYMAFFTILTVFYGLPIYIIRDMYLTFRSFSKRVNDYIKYQKATRDMNRKYPDATLEELALENICIVCREEMRPWQQPGAIPSTGGVMAERNRPKKLPCNHVLHFGCLRSWLERQQVCPICRRSVLMQPSPPAPNATPRGHDLPVRREPLIPAAVQMPANPPVDNDPDTLRLANQPGGRRFQLGPLQIEIGRIDPQIPPTAPQQQQEHQREPMLQLSDQRNVSMVEGQYQQSSDAITTERDTALLRDILNPVIANLQLAQLEAYVREQTERLSRVRHRLHTVTQQNREIGQTLSSRQSSHMSATGPTVQQLPHYSQPHIFALQSGLGLDTRGHPVDTMLPTGMVLPPGYRAFPLINVPPNLRAGETNAPAGIPVVVPPLNGIRDEVTASTLVRGNPDGVSRDLSSSAVRQQIARPGMNNVETMSSEIAPPSTRINPASDECTTTEAKISTVPAVILGPPAPTASAEEVDTQGGPYIAVPPNQTVKDQPTNSCQAFSGQTAWEFPPGVSEGAEHPTSGESSGTSSSDQHVHMEHHKPDTPGRGDIQVIEVEEA